MTQIRFFLTILLLISTLSAAKFSIRSSVDRKYLNVGDKIRYKVVIEFEKGLRIRKPGPGANLGQFDILDYNIDMKPMLDGMVMEEIEYIIAVYETGSYVIPPARTWLMMTNGEVMLETDPIEIIVSSVTNLGGKEEDIFAIAEPMLPEGMVPTRYYFFILTPLILGLLVLGAYIYRRRLYEMMLSVPPYEQALVDLTRLDDRDDLETGKYREYYYDFSWIVRVYIERSMGIPCTTLTTSQIKARFQEEKPDNGDFYLKLFTYADRVKFARHVPDTAVTIEFRKKVRDILNTDKRRQEARKQQLNKMKRKKKNVRVQKS